MKLNLVDMHVNALAKGDARGLAVQTLVIYRKKTNKLPTKLVKYTVLPEKLKKRQLSNSHKKKNDKDEKDDKKGKKTCCSKDR